LAEVAPRLAGQAARAGADALLAPPPYAIEPSVDGLVEYYTAIAAAADLPIMVQDGSDELRAIVPLHTLVRLCSAVPAIRYVKVEDVAPGPKITALAEALDGRVALLCGSGGLGILDSYDRGAIGCISGAATADLFEPLEAAYRAGSREAAGERYRALLPLIQFQCQATELFIAAEKRILARRGLIADARVRSPGYVLDDRELALLDALYDEARVTVEPQVAALRSPTSRSPCRPARFSRWPTGTGSARSPGTSSSSACSPTRASRGTRSAGASARAR